MIRKSTRNCSLSVAALFFAILTLLISAASLAQTSGAGQRPAQHAVVSGQPVENPQAQARILDGYGKLPLSFEANQGQTDTRVKFLSRTGGYTLFLTEDEAVLAWSGKKVQTSSPQGLKPASLAGSSGTAKGMPFPRTGPTTKSTVGGVLRMKLRNANPAAKVTGVDELAGTSNYFIGNNAEKWRTNVPTYAKVKYEGIYPGIDLVYYGNQRQLEYDFIVAPGADPHRIAFAVRGANRIRRDAHGDLVLTTKTAGGEIRWHKPIAYQEKDGVRQEIAAHYAITDTNRVAFELAKYDASRPLYIDPLIYSTYLGGSGGDGGSAIAVDSAGNAYVTGGTGSTDFPTLNPLQPANGGNGDAFVAKINPAGSALVYSTYLGGSGSDGGNSIAVDNAGNAYVTGSTCSTDFPTMNPLQPANGGGCIPYTSEGDAFVTKLNPTGSALVYSTYLGGSRDDVGNGIAVDSTRSAYVTGYTQSNDFPVTPGAFQTIKSRYINATDVFVVKINPTGSALVYSTYLGGGFLNWGSGIAADSAGNAYVTGAASIDFPLTPGAIQTSFGVADLDVFVSKINPTGSALVYSTYLGGPTGYKWGAGIAVDSTGDAYVTGYTETGHFPVTPGAFQTIFGGGYGDAFVSEINPTGSALVYSTYLGASLKEYAFGIAMDSAGNAYVTGYTRSKNFPTTTNAEQPAYGGAGDAFVAKINHTGALLYSTYLGGSGPDQGNGIAVGSGGKVYLTGSTGSIDFPTKNPLQATNAGNGDAYVAKISVPTTTPTATTLSSSPNPSIYGQALTFTAVVTSVLGAPPPDGETVTVMRGKTILGTGSLSGGSASFTTSSTLLQGGINYIKAVYGGDSNLLTSTSSAIKQAVNRAATTTTLTSSQNPSSFGQAVTFTASVAPQFSGTAWGWVTFYDGTTALKTVGMNEGAAKYTTSTLTSGSHSITATYSGSINFIASSASLTQTVD